MSKELEAIEKIKNYFLNKQPLSCKQGEMLVNIIEKSLKALEIIKEKGNFLNLDYNDISDKYYIYDNELYMHNEITKEEYDLLKSVI